MLIWDIEVSIAVLKRGITLHGIEAMDKIWLTCCALHNFLLEEDGLEMNWDSLDPKEVPGVVHGQETYISVWGGEMMKCWYVLVMMKVWKLALPAPIIKVLLMTITPLLSSQAKAHHLPPSKSKVWSLTWDQFRDRLVENFNIQWTRNEVIWPSQTGLGRIPNIE